MFYDKEQSVKPSDISEKELLNSLKETKIQEYTLISQMRCEGGRPYIEFLNRLFRCEVSRPEKIENYDVQVFDEPNEMISAIKKLNDKHGLCRNVAGYAWKWISKGKSKEEIKERDLYDIRFGDKKYLWNMTNEGWILRKESVDEIGCIHTTQGYDLNYAGVIFGKEIDYDGDKNEITIAREHFYDVNVKKGSSPDELKRYIVNAYKIMMERGIKGCYVCACNKNMSDYLKKYLSGISDERGI